ncbi:MAG: Sir2 silent information regulator family NAD-dependent deacetylase [Eubacteriales bacterium]|nr:Sir2 silent information regulator family NAD-dependent deacetylase [Eubacteriales bacterium]
MLSKKLSGNKSYERVNFQQFLCGVMDRNYIYQKKPYEEQIVQAAKFLEEADTVLLGAGAGLSAAAGLIYGGERFQRLFSDFIEKYGRDMRDMYSAGFYPYPSEEARWGYWCRHAYVNGIEPEGLPLYKALYELIKEKPYFVLTTNVDHQFQKSGFDENRIFATQGDYGEIQCARGCHDRVYDAVGMFRQMKQAEKDCCVPGYMVPKCPVCGGKMTMHLRSDGHFVEDEAWNLAAGRYRDFLWENRNKRIVLLELGVGFNTPVIIRLPFEKMMREKKTCRLIRLNLNEAFVPESFEARAVGINADIAKSIDDLKKAVETEQRQAAGKEQKDGSEGKA